MDVTDAASSYLDIVKNLESLNHPYAADSIDFILKLVDISDDMYVIIVNELGRSRITEDYIKLVTGE